MMLFFAQFWPGVLSAHDESYYVPLRGSEGMKHSSNTSRTLASKDGSIRRWPSRNVEHLQPGLASSHFFFRRRQVLPGTSQQHPAYPIATSKHTTSLTSPVQLNTGAWTQTVCRLWLCSHRRRRRRVRHLGLDHLLIRLYEEIRGYRMYRWLDLRLDGWTESHGKSIMYTNPISRNEREDQERI